MNEELNITLWQTHEKATRRNPVSTGVVNVCFFSNGGDLPKALCSGLMAMGGRHAPIKETYELIDSVIHNRIDLINILEICENYVPGFGSSFVKDAPDPMLLKIHRKLQEVAPEYITVAQKIKEVLADSGKNLYPNLAFYTAAVAHYNKINIVFCEADMIKARIHSWIEMLREESGE